MKQGVELRCRIICLFSSPTYVVLVESGVHIVLSYVSKLFDDVLLVVELLENEHRLHKRKLEAMPTYENSNVRGKICVGSP